MKAPRVELANVTRRYGELLAVREATLAIEPGEIHAIVGENGAGKSTLLKMAAGVIAPSSGEVRIDDGPLVPATPGEAYRRGVGMVHQHFMLVGAFRAIENVMLGSEPVIGLRLDEAEAMRRARLIQESAGLEVRLDALTSELTVGERQRLEILRVLYRGARAILLDEPTAVLSPIEADELYATLKTLAAEGRTIAVVTHRLDEVVRFADRVTVMRRGAIVLARSSKASEDELTRAIMGGDPPPEFSPPEVAKDAGVALSLRGVRLSGEDGRALLAGIDLEIKAGEIVGVAGVEGNGQRELVRVITGLEPAAIGVLRAGDRDLAGLDVRARRQFVGVVHEDRHADGLLLDATTGDNLVLGDIGDVGELREQETIARRIKRFDVRPPDPSLLAGELSGGNQQKLVIARALDRTSKPGRVAVVLAQPTRGVDVGAAAAIHAAIGEAARGGLGVLVISADLAELRRLSHRLVVIRRGAIVGELSPSAPPDVIGRAMLGLEAA